MHSGDKRRMKNREKVCVFSGEGTPGHGWARGFSSSPKRGNLEECSGARGAAPTVAALPAW